jgi:dephospho-CoA kinase
VTIRIGLTGPIGCGKSTVAKWLGERPGVVVIDADQVARDVVEPGQPALGALIAQFGADLQRSDGSLDRAALGRIVFADPKALDDLEAIVHPEVRRRILAALSAAAAEGAEAVVVEAIRLVEGGLAELCDEVWLITCDPTVQRERLVARGSSPADAAQRISAQAGIDERVRPIATRVIDSSGDPSATRSNAEAALTEVTGGHRAERPPRP